jgi:hypothetical protein
MKKTVDEWKELKATDPCVVEGAKVLNRWLENSPISEEEFVEGISKFNSIAIGVD